MSKMDRMNRKSVKFLFVSQNSPIECEVIRQVHEGICLCRLLDKSPDDEEALFCCTVKGLENFIGSFVKITVEHSKTDGPKNRWAIKIHYNIKRLDIGVI